MFECDGKLGRVAIIPARGGSKRIPRKNIRGFLGRPMIAWPIEALLDSNMFDCVYVSTDDSEIATIAADLGAKIVWRDPRLADDFTHTTEVVKDALIQLIPPDANPWVYQIYPTTPTTTNEVHGFIDFTESATRGMSISVSKTIVPIQRALTLDENKVLSFREPEFALNRTQDLGPLYFDSGKFYGGRKSDWLETVSPLLSSARGYPLPDWLSVDFDTLEDWDLAEYKFKRKFGGLI